MNIKKRIHYVVVMLTAIIALPFILAAAVISMIALGIYYLATLVMEPALMLYRMVKPRKSGEYKYLMNPVIKFSNWLVSISFWKGE